MCFYASILRTGSDLEESGAVLRAGDLRAYYENPRVLGLAEMMNAPGTVRAEKGVLAKLKDCSDRGKRIDGHAPGLSGHQLNAYCAAGVASDHECSESRGSAGKAPAGTVIMIARGQQPEIWKDLFHYASSLMQTDVCLLRMINIREICRERAIWMESSEKQSGWEQIR